MNHPASAFSAARLLERSGNPAKQGGSEIEIYPPMADPVIGTAGYASKPRMKKALNSRINSTW